MAEQKKTEASVGAIYDVVIAGAGFSGLALALALKNSLSPRARVAVVCRESGGPAAGTPDSRALALSASSIRVLELIGAWGRCKARAQAVTSIDITDSSLEAGVRPVLLSYGNEIDGKEPASHIVPDTALLDALWQQAEATDGLVLLKGDGVDSFHTAPDTIDLRLTSGARHSARLLVASDGKRSRIRDLAGIKTISWSYRQRGITVIVKHDRPHEGRAVQHFLPAGPFAMLPLPGNRTCITWSEGEAEAQRVLALDDAGFLAEVETRAGGRLGALTLDGPRQSWPLDLSLARSFIAPRLALVGDAAHGVHPIAGQGLNLGLRDVAALAEVIVDAERLGLDIGASTTLERYERWRRFDTWMSALGFDGLNRLFSSDVGLLRSVRDLGLGIVNRLPRLKEQLVAEAAGTTGELPRLMRGEAL